jgi:peptide deformylase
MSTRQILLLGNPVLRERCVPVKDFATSRLNALIDDLYDTLHDFRTRNGFGRGIAAPQIGYTERVVFVHAEKPLALINPVVARRSRKMVTLWDDCFSFPDLLVKVRRALSVDVRYQDPEGRKHTLEATGSLSELLQHEIDHVNGILAIDRATDSRHIVLRSEYRKWGKAAIHAL